MSRAKDVVEVVANALVDQSGEVVVTETERQDEIRVELKVSTGDLGRLIGRQGRTAAAVRALATAAVELDDQRVRVDFVDGD